MLTYALLNTAIMCAIIIFVITRSKKAPFRKVATVLSVLLLMTLMFDSIIVKQNIYSYHLDRILGIYLGYAPVEDFAYPIAAVLLIPYLWKIYADKD